jgi:hypothetical protein
LGKQQDLWGAQGCVLEDFWGTVDGHSRGVMVLGITTNKMTNPVFGYLTDYKHNWLGGADLVVTENTDPAYLLPGAMKSAKIISHGATHSFYMSINVGNVNKHSFSAYVIRPDRAAVTSADMNLLVNNGGVASTYTLVGNGIYKVTYINFDGINAAKNFGINVTAGRTVYLLGVQLEEKAYDTPLAWGDLVGCLWTGTVHDSTSSRLPGSLFAPDTWGTLIKRVMNFAQGSISFVWKTSAANTFATDITFFTLGAATFVANFTAADDKINFTDGTNTISSAAQTFAVGDILRLLFTWGPGGLNVYKNGVNIATGATYTPPVNSTLTIDYTLMGTVMGFTSYPVELTPAENITLDANISKLTAADRRVDSFPYFTVAASGVINNCHSVTQQYEYSTFCVGIPGDSPALTEMHLRTDAAGDHYFDFDVALWMSLLSMDYADYADPVTSGLFMNLTGTVTLITDCESDVQTASIPELTWTTGGHTHLNRYKLLAGKEISLFARLADAGGNLNAHANIAFGSTLSGGIYYIRYLGKQNKLTGSDAIFRLYRTLPVVLPDQNTLLMKYPNTTAVVPAFHMMRDVGAGTHNVTLDYLVVMPRPLVKITKQGDISGAADGIFIRFMGGESVIVDGTYPNEYAIDSPKVEGDYKDFMLEPDKYNLIQFLRAEFGYPLDIHSVTAIYQIIVTPRWSLL